MASAKARDRDDAFGTIDWNNLLTSAKITAAAVTTAKSTATETSEEYSTGTSEEYYTETSEEDSVTETFEDDSYIEQSVRPIKTYKSGHILSTATNGNIVCSEVPLLHGVMVMLNPPASFIVHQHVGIFVLSGRVSVFGYIMSPKKSPVKVFSTEKTGLIEVKTLKKDINKKEDDPHVKDAFYNIILNKKKADRLLNQFKDFSVAIFVQSLPYPTEMQLLEHYFLDFKTIVKPSDLNCETNLRPIQFGMHEQTLARNIITKIRHSVLLELDAPRILVFGPKNTRKSTLIRYLINKMLSLTDESAYYLDTDPDQSEFTPPGVVSLAKVDKPIFGPAFYQLKKDIPMIFTGDISTSSPDMYSNSVSKLMQLYEEKYKNHPLFVNTIGWKNGIESACLKNVMAIVKPTVVVEMVTEGKSFMSDFEDYIYMDCLLNVPIPSPKMTPYFSAKEMRDFAILSYLGKDLSIYNGVLPINEMRPYCVSWDKIPVYIFNQRVQPWRIIEAINLSIVGLCVVQETAVLESHMPEFATTLEDEPENKCIGFGFVRAIDEEKHILYIVTSINKNMLRRVNAIMKGNIMVPDVVIAKQDICKVPLPFTVESKVCTPTDEMETSSSSLSPSLKKVESSTSKRKICDSEDFSLQRKKRARKK